MKTIQILKTLINILFYALIVVFIIGLLFFLVLYFFPDSLPVYLRGFSMLFNGMFSWKLFLVPTSSVINIMVLIVAIFYLRKSITSFTQADYYSDAVTNNLKKAGSLFLFIGISSIIIQLLAVFFVQSIANNMFSFKTNFLIALSNIVAAAIDLKSFLSIIIGLFFLLFSKIFEHSRLMKQENDLTI